MLSQGCLQELFFFDSAIYYCTSILDNWIFASVMSVFKAGHSEVSVLALCYMAILKRYYQISQLSFKKKTAGRDQITKENVEIETYNWFGSKGADCNKQRIALNCDWIK